MAAQGYKVALACAMTVAIFGKADGQVFEIDNQSGFVYFPPTGAGISGCGMDPTRCDFGIGGTVEVSISNDVLTFSSASFLLTGNQSVQDNPPAGAVVTDSTVQSALLDNNLMLPLVSNIGGVAVYNTTYGNNGLLEATISNSEFELTGGRDDLAIGGDAFTFDIRSFQIPEPNSMLLAILASLTVRRFRRLRVSA